ncbi:MAG: DUF1464 family protein [Aeropyrum sp.]|nr:DUF1464 family protein [Aeropyrum sp.]MCE4615873.1 DUF1464 family protein [Aeropyrum sp.]
MVKAIGIDPGTGSMDIVGFDDETGEVFLDTSIPRDDVTRDPSLPLRIVEEAANTVGGVDAVVAPSGYGVPLKRAQDATDTEICEATFIHALDEVRGLRIVGLRRLMHMFRESHLPAWFTPGVIHLPTVPRYRKLGRIDLGTADKLYTVAAALATEVDRWGGEPHTSSFIVVEAGLAYNAALAVVGGSIVDAIAGTSGPPGFLGGGCMDGELAYALCSVEPRFSKSFLFKGGAESILAGKSVGEFREMLAKGDPRAIEAKFMIVEGIAKSILSLSIHMPGRELKIYLSGRLFRLGELRRLLESMLEEWSSKAGATVEFRELEKLGGMTKEGASGAAIIASGLAGGRYSWIIDSLRLRESRGSIFDYIALDGDIRRRIIAEFRSCRPSGIYG